MLTLRVEQNGAQSCKTEFDCYGNKIEINETEPEGEGDSSEGRNGEAMNASVHAGDRVRREK